MHFSNYCHRITESQNHRMARVGRDLKDHESPTPCHTQGHQPPHFTPAQAAQGPIQPGLEPLQGWTGHPQPLWAAVPAPHHPLCKELKLPLFQWYLERNLLPRGISETLTGPRSARAAGQGSWHLPLHGCTQRRSHSTRGHRSPPVPILSLPSCWHSPAVPNSLLQLLGALGTMPTGEHYISAADYADAEEANHSSSLLFRLYQKLSPLRGSPALQ